MTSTLTAAKDIPGGKTLLAHSERVYYAWFGALASPLLFVSSPFLHPVIVKRLPKVFMETFMEDLFSRLRKGL